MLTSKVLLLNQNYEPMNVVTAKKAIILVVLQKVEIIEKRAQMIHSQHFALPLPSIIRLMRFVRVPYKRIELNRANVFKRDGYRCQYCGTKKAPFTIDHVMPRKNGRIDSWENLVCACVKCNNKKGDRTPEEAHMPLLRQPRKPNHLFFIQHFMGHNEECWKPYLFMN
jgi:5-methylcytosine-specific restriction endonuclease McrA